MKVWISKYALTQGIFEVEVGPLDNCTRMVGYKIPASSFLQYAHGEGKQWHWTKQEALKRADDMREAKLKSLYKTIKKLHAMEF